MDQNFILDFNQSLKQEFYLQSAELVAKNLIGKVLIKKINNKEFLAAKIVETEAYLATGDESCHTYKGMNSRNKSMYEIGGTLYVYKIFGLHYCINIVTENKGTGSAVLIRAVEPIIGLEIMQINRKVEDIIRLCKGPGSLTQAYQFDLNDNFKSVLTENLFIQDYHNYKDEEIKITTRIGITKSADLPLRFYLKSSKYVSGKKS